jgi:hypothetical protein
MGHDFIEKDTAKQDLDLVEAIVAEQRALAQEEVASLIIVCSCNSSRCGCSSCVGG